STDSQAITESNVAQAVSGSIGVTDVDSPATFVAQAGTAGSYGTFTIEAAGAWSYTMGSAMDSLSAGQVVTETFTVASADGTSKPAAVTVTITGTNDAAVISTDSQAITESNVAQAVSGSIGVTDVDSPATFVAQAGTAGSYGTFTIEAAGAWSYTMGSAMDSLSAGQVVTETFTVASADGTSKPAAVTVTITGTNDAAVISTDSQAITESNVAQAVSGSIGVTDVDSPATFVAQAGTAGSYGTFTIDAAGAWSYTMGSAMDSLSAGQVVTETFTVASADGTSKPAAVTVTITGTNDAAVISTDSQAITESNVAQAVSGSIGVTDVDSPATFV